MTSKILDKIIYIAELYVLRAFYLGFIIGQQNKLEGKKDATSKLHNLD